VSHLGLSQSQERLLVPEVDFNSPSPEKVLEEFLDGDLIIGANEIGRLTVKDFGGLGEPVSQGGDDHDPQSPGALHASEDSIEQLDFEGVNLPRSMGFNLFPGDRIILAQFLRCGSPKAINLPASELGLVLRGIVELGILANAADESGLGREVFEDGLVGESTVDTDDQVAMSPGGGVELLAEMFNTLNSDLVDVHLLCIGLVLIPVLLRGVFPWLAWSWSMLEINWNETSGTIRTLRYCRRELNEPLSPNEVDTEGRSQGITPVTHSRNLPSRLAQDGVVHGGDEGMFLRQEMIDLPPNPVKEQLWLGAAAAVESVIGRPVTVLPSLATDQTAQGVSSQTNQLTEHMGSGSLELNLVLLSRQVRAKQMV